MSRQKDFWEEPDYYVEHKQSDIRKMQICWFFMGGLASAGSLLIIIAAFFPQTVLGCLPF